MSILLFIFQDFVGILAEIAKQGTAILVLFLILVFIIVLITKILPTWERVKTAESNAQTSVATALGELASSQSQLAAVVKDIAVEQRQSTDAVKILQRVNARSNEQLASDVQQLTESLQGFTERLDRLENKENGKLSEQDSK